jgi:hypothetical protein
MPGREYAFRDVDDTEIGDALNELWGKAKSCDLCRRRDVPLREMALWRMLYESASRQTQPGGATGPCNVRMDPASDSSM